MQKLRIAQIAPLVERIPPYKYGGIERVVFCLTEELVKRGHDVTLFASGDSITSAKLVSVAPKPLRYEKGVDPYRPNAVTALNYGLAYSMHERFDIIHDHLGSVSLPTANLSKTPVISTIHGTFDKETSRLYSVLTKPYAVTISEKQLRMGPKNLNHAGTVYNGLDMDAYPFSKNHKGYLLFVGRITIEKGVHHAIKAAEITGLPLIIAAKLETKFHPDVDYFHKYIKPKLSDKIRWIGEVDENKRNKLMSQALCLLHPVTWEEPFGLVMIEAQACGLPVIGFNLGSIPEVVEHGKTGYVVSTVEGLVRAISKIGKIDRGYCRKRALQKFSSKVMTDNYEKIYYKVLEMEDPKTSGKRKPVEPLTLYTKYANSSIKPLLNNT